MIEILNESFLQDFLSGDYAFKVCDSEGNVHHIVTTLNEYVTKLKTHLYTPLLYKIDIYTRLAYITGCLNLEYNKPRKSSYTFYLRKIHTLGWKPWFKVHPEKDV